MRICKISTISKTFSLCLNFFAGKNSGLRNAPVYSMTARNAKVKKASGGGAMLKTNS